MAATLRDQNVCYDCRHTWYPRGKDLSTRCPNCGSHDVHYVPACFESSDEDYDVWDGIGSHLWRAAKWFCIVSSPVFLTGAIIAPQGTNRVDHALYLVGQQHEFLWGYAGGGLKNTFNAIGSVVGPILDNGASEAE